MKQFRFKCETHEIATNLTAFLNSIPNIKAKDLGGFVKITKEQKKRKRRRRREKNRRKGNNNS